MAVPVAGEPHDAGGKREQREHADGSERRQQHQNVEFRIIVADINEAGGGAHQSQGDQQHKADRAAARRALAFVEGLPPLPFAAVRRRSLFCLVLTCHDSWGP